jgi:23S rRNA (cytosine1962-C5)-methyltransferase
LPGLFVDRWGPVVVATRTTLATKAFASIVYDAVSEQLPGLPIYEKDHLSDLRTRGDAQSGDALRGRWMTGRHPDDEVEVLEAGLRFHSAPFGGLTTGFYPDQRANRAHLAALPDLPGGCVANLFAHTGAFSVALAAAGARRVFSIDLSPRYLDLAASNLRRNGLDPDEHPCVATDAVRWIIENEEPLDGVVIDPPVFAQGRGRTRGFSAKDGYRNLVSLAVRRLRPGGWLLCCRNLRAERTGRLRKDVEAGIRDAGRTPTAVEAAGPAIDFPTQRGFPEGTTFHGVFARVGT